MSTLLKELFAVTFDARFATTPSSSRRASRGQRRPIVSDESGSLCINASGQNGPWAISPALQKWHLRRSVVNVVDALAVPVECLGLPMPAY